MTHTVPMVLLGSYLGALERFSPLYATKELYSFISNCYLRFPVESFISQLLISQDSLFPSYAFCQRQNNQDHEEDTTLKGRRSALCMCV